MPTVRSKAWRGHRLQCSAAFSYPECKGGPREQVGERRFRLPARAVGLFMSHECQPREPQQVPLGGYRGVGRNGYHGVTVTEPLPTPTSLLSAFVTTTVLFCGSAGTAPCGRSGPSVLARRRSGRRHRNTLRVRRCKGTRVTRRPFLRRRCGLHARYKTRPCSGLSGAAGSSQRLAGHHEHFE